LSLTRWQVAVASTRWETKIQDKGSLESGLVLAPLSEGLYCAVLPASKFPTAALQHPQQETELPADNSPPTDIPRETELLQGEDPCSHQTNGFAAVGQLMSQQHAFVQAHLQQLQAQQFEQHASLDAHLALGDGLTSIPCANEPVTAENCAGADFGLIGPHLEQWYDGNLNLFTSYTQL
jgi:hypothetical protein